MKSLTGVISLLGGVMVQEVKVGGGEKVHLFHCQLLSSESVGHSTEGEEEGSEVRLSWEQLTAEGCRREGKRDQLQVKNHG